MTSLCVQEWLTTPDENPFPPIGPLRNPFLTPLSFPKSLVTYTGGMQGCLKNDLKRTQLCTSKLKAAPDAFPPPTCSRLLPVILSSHPTPSELADSETGRLLGQNQPSSPAMGRNEMSALNGRFWEVQTMGFSQRFRPKPLSLETQIGKRRRFVPHILSNSCVFNGWLLKLPI